MGMAGAAEGEFMADYNPDSVSTMSRIMSHSLFGSAAGRISPAGSQKNLLIYCFRARSGDSIGVQARAGLTIMSSADERSVETE